MNIGDLPLPIHALPEDPFDLFHRWIKIAEDLNSDCFYYANASLATIGENGYPDARMMTLAEFNEKNIVFTTPLTEGKAKQLSLNPKASLNFYWRELKGQIRLWGDTEPVSEEKADELFSKQDRMIKIITHTYPQSDIVGDPKVLDRRRKEVEQKYWGQEIPRPQNWSGFYFYPIMIEFWLDFTRIRYSKKMDQWKSVQLAP